MPYRIAGIDVHKKMLAIAVAEVEIEGDVHFERLKVGTSPVQLRALAEWLVERDVEEVVMESTAQYWRPVWEALERYWRPKRRTRLDASPVSGILHLAQAQSNRGAGGGERDFPDAERLVKRLVAQELTLSFVPDAEQRLWRTVMRRKYQITRSRVQLHNRLEALLEEAHIKISSVVSDLLGTSARRMLHAVGDGETDPAALASLGRSAIAGHARAIARRLRRVRGSASGVYRRLVKLTLDELRTIEDHLSQLDQQMAQLLAPHHDPVQRLAEVPGLGVDSDSHRSPKGNRQMRRRLNQSANAAVKTKGSIFELVYRRLVPRLGHPQAIGAIAHRLCRLIWKILHQGIQYEEHGPAINKQSQQARARRMIRELRSLGYRVELVPGPSSNPA